MSFEGNHYWDVIHKEIFSKKAYHILKVDFIFTIVKEERKKEKKG